MSTGVQMQLLVVPSDHPSGEQAMAAATEPTVSFSPAQILANAALADGEDCDSVAEGNEYWFDEGDVWWSRPEDGPPSMRCGL